MLNIKKAITVSSILLNNFISLSLFLIIFCLPGRLYAQTPLRGFRSNPPVPGFPPGRELDSRHPFDLKENGVSPSAISENVFASLSSLASLNCEFVGATGGIVYDVFVQGNYAYLCAGGILVILDVSAPAHPTKVGNIALPALALGVYVSGSYAYVADDVGGLRVIDISSPSNPREVGFYDTPGEAYGVHVSGRYAYVADDVGGLRVIDISSPSNPREVGFYDTSGYAFGVYVSGSYAYVADYDYGLCVIDVSSPENPKEVGFYNTPGYAYGVYVSGSLAYVADGSSGLRVIDVSSPENPKEVGFCDTPDYALDVYVSGSLAYVADDWSGLRVIDVSSPENPFEVGSCDTPGYAWGVYVSDSLAYVADYRSGLRVIDVSSPKNPKEVGFYDTLGWAYDVYVSGSLAYVAGWDYGLRVIDVSSPENPREVGFYDTPGWAYGVYVSGSLAYVADSSSGLRVIDVSSPENPFEVGSCDTPDFAEGVYVSGSYAYVADYYSLRVIDVSSSSNPKGVGFYDTFDSAYDVYVSGGLIYVAGGEGGLYILRYTGGGDAGTVTLDTPGPPTWSYILTWDSGAVSQWSYTGARITGANVTGSAAAAGWRVFSQTNTKVVFTTETPLTSGTLSGFEISGTMAGIGTWTCHAYSGNIEGALPVELSAFTATVSNDGVTLRWRTESEVNNLGFNLYRSDAKDGKYIKVNSRLIAGAGSDATPHDYSFTDENVVLSKTYYYYIEDIDFSGKTNKSHIIEVTVVKQSIKTHLVPPTFALLQNYPNPFNPDTWIPFELASSSPVTIQIYDTKGQLIRTIASGNRNAGIYVTKDKAAYWDGRDSSGEKVASGIYFYTLRAGEFSATRKMVILK